MHTNSENMHYKDGYDEGILIERRRVVEIINAVREQWPQEFTGLAHTTMLNRVTER